MQSGRAARVSRRAGRGGWGRSGSEAGSYLRLNDFVHHSTVGLRVMKKKRWGQGTAPRACQTSPRPPTRHPPTPPPPRPIRARDPTCPESSFSAREPCAPAKRAPRVLGEGPGSGGGWGGTEEGSY